MNYAMCVKMVTGYAVGEIDLANYSRLLQEVEKNMKGEQDEQ